MPLTADQVIAAATAENADPATIQSMIDGALQEHTAAEVADLKRKNGEIFDKLEALKPLKKLGQELGSAEEIREALAERKRLEEELEAAKHGVDNAEVDKLVEQRLAERMEAHRQTIADKRAAEKQELADEKAARAEEHSRFIDEKVRRMMRLHSRGIIDGLEDDVYNRLRRVFHEDEETGAIVLRNPETKAVLQGEKGDMTTAELFEGLKASNGSDPWNSKGAGYFRGNGHGDDLEETRRTAGSPPKNLKRSEMSISDKVAYQERWGLEAFRKLPR